MKVMDSLIAQGRYLFQWRSYAPLVLLPVAAMEFAYSGWVSTRFGVAVEDDWDLFCLCISASGIGLRILTVGFVPSSTSGRSTTRLRAAQLNTTGMYSLVRHPLYAANFVVFVGFAFVIKSAVFILLATAAFVIYYERIILVEEQFLETSYGDEFREWAARTPAVIPQIRPWAAPSLPFSWRAALQREYHGVLLIGIVFFTIKLSEGLIMRQQTFQNWFANEKFYVIMLLLCSTFYLAASYIRKRTSWLAVAGRGP